jgi:hypothetical protein
LQIAPRAFDSSHPWSLAEVRERARVCPAGPGDGDHRRRGWRGGEASPRRCAPGGGQDRVGVGCSGDATGTVRPAVEMDGGNGALVVGGGGEVVEKLQGDVEKLGVEAIGVEEGRREVSHGE